MSSKRGNVIFIYDKKKWLCSMNYFLTAMILGKVYKVKHHEIGFSRAQEGAWNWENIPDSIR